MMTGLGIQWWDWIVLGGVSVAIAVVLPWFVKRGGRNENPDARAARAELNLKCATLALAVFAAGAAATRFLQERHWAVEADRRALTLRLDLEKQERRRAAFGNAVRVAWEGAHAKNLDQSRLANAKLDVVRYSDLVGYTAQDGPVLNAVKDVVTKLSGLEPKKGETPTTKPVEFDFDAMHELRESAATLGVVSDAELRNAESKMTAERDRIGKP